MEIRILVLAEAGEDQVGAGGSLGQDRGGEQGLARQRASLQPRPRHQEIQTPPTNVKPTSVEAWFHGIEEGPSSVCEPTQSAISKQTQQ